MLNWIMRKDSSVGSNLILFQLLLLEYQLTSIFALQGYISRVVSTIIFISIYYAMQLRYYYSHAILAIIPSFIQHQLTSLFVLLEIHIQSSQFYHPSKYISYYIVKILLFSYYTSYHIQFFIVLVNQYIYTIRGIYLDYLELLFL